MQTKTSLPETGSPLDFRTLAARYRAAECTAIDVAKEILDRIDACDDDAIWIERFSREEVLAQAERIEQRRRAGVDQPLYGLPFAVKDTLDVAGHATTAACPAYAYIPKQTAPSVRRLCDAGAILVGKTNLDQFATGLVGTRTPYGICRNLFKEGYVPGGSSSGSAVAVAAGLVSFTLGTDTAGSGRVPAAFNNIVGLKPTRGLISTTGLVPACRSLDCVSIFALTCEDTATVAQVAAGYDPADSGSHRAQDLPQLPRVETTGFRFGIPAAQHLRFFGNDAAADLYHRAVQRMQGLGGTRVEIDFEPFVRVGQLLYEGPWVAERLEVAGDLLARQPEALLPVTRSILSRGTTFTAADVFRAMHELRALINRSMSEWAKMDLLLLPTTGTIYTIAQVEADPINLNANLGYYTHFANLMDLCALAVPNGFQPDGLPAGMMLVGRAGRDGLLTSIGSRYQRATGLQLGATGWALPPATSETSRS